MRMRKRINGQLWNYVKFLIVAGDSTIMGREMDEPTSTRYDRTRLRPTPGCHLSFLIFFFFFSANAAALSASRIRGAS
jgi:hypothetical protein